MVHKKYTYKKGKRYGPYLYHTKRVDGKIVTTYLGKHTEEERKRTSNSLYYYLLLSILGALILLFFIFPSEFGLTGEASLDIKARYEPGEQITGNLRLIIKEGELIPGDSRIIVVLGEEEKEFTLLELIESDLIDIELTEGDFYVSGADISGSGQGFGLIGEKGIFDEVEFELLIYETEEEPGEEPEEEITEEPEEEIEEGEETEEELEEEEPEEEQEKTSEEESGDEGGDCAD